MQVRLYAKLHKIHTFTKHNSFCNLILTPEQLAAVQAVILAANEILARHTAHLQPYERDCITLSNLASIQPNLHNNDPYLPLHIDDCRHDGFGIVIVTVALWGTGDIVIADADDTYEGDTIPSWSFQLVPGQLYTLSGPSRNLYIHGVIATPATAEEPAAGKLTLLY